MTVFKGDIQEGVAFTSNDFLGINNTQPRLGARVIQNLCFLMKNWENDQDEKGYADVLYHVSRQSGAREDQINCMFIKVS